MTLPLSVKSRSCEGPTVSDEAGGAAVTSTGASAFWANAGLATIRRSAAAAPFNALIVMRRIAVISPPCWLPERTAPPAPVAGAMIAPLLACKSREDKYLPASPAPIGTESAPAPAYPALATANPSA